MSFECRRHDNRLKRDVLLVIRYKSLPEQSPFACVSDFSARCSLWLCICATALWPLSNLIVVCHCVPAVQTGGAVHVFSQAAGRHEAKNPRLLRASLPGQDVRRGEHPGRVERAASRGELSVPICVLNLLHRWM